MLNRGPTANSMLSGTDNLSVAWFDYSCGYSIKGMIQHLDIYFFGEPHQKIHIMCVKYIAGSSNLTPYSIIQKYVYQHF